MKEKTFIELDRETASCTNVYSADLSMCYVKRKYISVRMHVRIKSNRLTVVENFFSPMTPWIEVPQRY